MPSDHYILDAAGQPVPCDVMTWARWYETADRHVAKDAVTDPATGAAVNVSTVFLSLDHSFGDGPAVLWETMIFGGAHDQSEWRYTSREAAVAGHKAAVAFVLGSGPEPD